MAALDRWKAKVFGEVREVLPIAPVATHSVQQRLRKTALGQTRHFDVQTITSCLPRTSDVPDPVGSSHSGPQTDMTSITREWARVSKVDQLSPRRRRPEPN